MHSCSNLSQYSKSLSMRLSNPTYFFPSVGNSRCWEILFKENLLHGIPRSNRTWKNREKSCLCCPFQRERESFQLNLFFINSIWFHANTNHMELLEMSMRIFSCKAIECWYQMYKTRFELQVYIIVNVYAQWLIFHVRSSKLLECLLSCNHHDVEASFLS